MSTNLDIYHAILFNKRVAAYKLNSEYWYVIEWGKKVYLHYTEKVKSHKKEFYWYLADSTLWPEWRCQTDILTISESPIIADKISLEDIDIMETERSIKENPGCDIY